MIKKEKQKQEEKWMEGRNCEDSAVFLCWSWTPFQRQNYLLSNYSNVELWQIYTFKFVSSPFMNPS